jgi:hypothetical protein
MKLLEATKGRNNGSYWYAAASLAEAVHLAGDRERATPMFDAVLKLVPPPGHAFPNASEENSAAWAREIVATRQLAEGRPEQALALFAQARIGFVRAPAYGTQMRHLRLEIADAHSAARHPKATALLRAALAENIASAPPGESDRLRARESWARQLARNGDRLRAGQEWQHVLEESQGHASAVTVRACEGLAELALANRDGEGALEWVARGRDMLAHVKGSRDSRLASVLDVTRARALLATRRPDEALAVASSAAQFLRRSNAPGSADLAEAEQTLHRAQEAAAR